MSIICLSASNSRKTSSKSISSIVCKLIDNSIRNVTKNQTVLIKTISLKDYELSPCKLCGECVKNSKCVCDDDFNVLYNELVASEGLFIVMPHYSPWPSKLIILLEKLNEIVYGNWIINSDTNSLFHNIKVAIVAHGGMVESEEVLNYYQQSLVRPLARTLKSLGFDVISVDNQLGITFGLEDNHCIEQVPDQLFPNIKINENLINRKIKPLVVEFIKSLSL